MDREEDHNEIMDRAIAIANANEDDDDDDDDDDIDMNNEIGLGNVALDPEEIRLIDGVNVQINNRDNNNNNNVNADDDDNDNVDGDDDDEEVNGNGNDNDNEEEDEEDNDDEEEDDENENENENENDDEEDIIEGGCANEGSNKLSTGCAMYLIFECKESPLENSNDGSVRGKDKDKSVHPIYQVGSKVQIGMEKTTRLSAVFARYTEFANNYNCQSDKSKSEANANAKNNKNKNKKKSEHEHAPLQICPSELEFSHCSILLRTDTAETSALMKKDRIAVHRVRTETRMMGLERLRAQQNSDRDYFKQMKGLLAITSSSSSSTSIGMGSNAGTGSGTGTGTGISKSSSASASNSDKKPKFEGEIVLDCRGRVNQQQVLNTYVRAHEGLIAKRCNWLALRIDAARGEFADSGDHEDDRDGDHDRDEDQQQQQEQNDHDMQEDLVFEANQIQNQNQNNNNENNINNRNNNNNNVVPIEDDDDDGFQIEIFNRNMRQNNNNNNNNNNSNAVPIAIDADADADTSNHNISRDHDLQYVGNNSPINKRNTLRVVLNYPPEAVRLLLEYCYTNRVISLGSTAFRKSYKPINKQIMDPLLVKFSGPASPFPAGSASAGLRSTWPKMGKPTVELSVALAGIQLAEEANMPRLSLMCEIAASQLVTPSTCLEALVLCEQQYRNTGNRLTHLRQAVMLYHVIGSGPKGVDDLSGSSSFKRTLKEKRNDAVPSLLMGIMETVKFVLGEKDNKHNNQSLLLDLKRKRNASMYAE